MSFRLQPCCLNSRRQLVMRSAAASVSRPATARVREINRKLLSLRFAVRHASQFDRTLLVCIGPFWRHLGPRTFTVQQTRSASRVEVLSTFSGKRVSRVTQRVTAWFDNRCLMMCVAELINVTR